MTRTLRRAACGALLCALSLPAIEIELANGRFLVRGCPPGTPFSVYVGDAATPMLGATATSAGTLTFTPKYPLAEGLTYRAVLATTPPLTRTFTIPRARREPTRLLAIYPTAARLPENMLKMYLHFSAPMSRGEAYRRVQLLDAHNRPVELAILEIEQELWDRSGARLTLLFDPGRIKRDLLPNKDVGPPLQAGRDYTLAIDAAWPDAHGQPLAAPASKRFSVVEPDRTPPEASTWKLTTPRAATRDALTLAFPESMDRALLEQLIAVHDAHGDTLPGTLAFENEERLWRFTPDAPWSPAPHAIVYDTSLEDLAGNRIGRPFDVDLFEQVDREVKREFRRLPFQPKP